MLECAKSYRNLGLCSLWIGDLYWRAGCCVWWGRAREVIWSCACSLNYAIMVLSSWSGIGRLKNKLIKNIYTNYHTGVAPAGGAVSWSLPSFSLSWTLRITSQIWPFARLDVRWDRSRDVNAKYIDIVWRFKKKNCFLCNCLSDRCETLYKGRSPHGEYFIANSDVIIHMVWQQPYWIKGKKKFKIATVSTTPQGV